MADETGGGEGRSDVLFIVLVIVFLIVAWFLSGAARGASVGTIFTPFPGSNYTSSTTKPIIGIPSVSFGDGSGIEFDQSETNTITDEVAAVRKEVESLKALPSSPYAGKISITSAWSGRQTSAKSEYVVVRASSNNPAPVVISNWRIESAVSGRTAYIRSGVATYQQGSANATEPIVLYPGEEAIVSTGRSPIGTSFRINKCSEYLTQFQEFIPSLSSQCPAPIDEASDSLDRSVYTDNTCLDYIDTLQTCRIDLTPPTNLSEACRSFIFNRLTYQGCVQEHRNDFDFKTKQWRIYLGYDESLWREKREVLALLDEQGKLVDSTTY